MVGLVSRELWLAVESQSVRGGGHGGPKVAFKGPMSMPQEDLEGVEQEFIVPVTASIPLTMTQRLRGVRAGMSTPGTQVGMRIWRERGGGYLCRGGGMH